MGTTGICGHCGQTAGDYAGGSSFVPDADGLHMMLVCHPNDETRPDCFRRITVYREPLGALVGVERKPAGVDGLTAPAVLLAQVEAFCGQLEADL